MKKSGLLAGIILIISIFSSTVSAQYQITGTVNYDGNPNVPMQYVTLGLYDLNDNLVSETVSGADGGFLFDSIAGGQYVMHSTTTLSAGGVDFWDAHLILMSIVVPWFNLDDIQFEAADVNNDEDVTFSDYFIVLFNYIINGQPLPNDWQFEEVSIDLTSRVNPAPIFTWGVSEGDVEGEWIPIGRDLVLNNEVYETPLSVDSESLTELYIGSDYGQVVSGFNLNFSFPSEMIEIVEVISPNDNEIYHMIDNENGILRVAWMNESGTSRNTVNGHHLFKMKVRTLEGVHNGQRGSFVLLPEGGLLDDNGKIDDVIITIPTMVADAFSHEYTIEDQMVCYPNPVREAIHFKLNIIENNYTTISIFDLQGRIISRNAIMVPKGSQTFTVSTGELKAGQYSYLIETSSPKTNISGKFIKVN